MEHIKTHHAEQIRRRDNLHLTVEGPVPPQLIANYRMHSGLKAFRLPQQQQKALMEIAALDEGRIVVAHDEREITGYVTFHYPDPMERWSEGKLENLLELGGIEIAAEYRNQGLAKKLLHVAFQDKFMENYIVITTEYYWHWDLETSGLNVWDYRQMMEKMMSSAGLEWMATDDPEICAHPANALMVRFGKNVTPQDIAAFDQLRFRQRFMY